SAAKAAFGTSCLALSVLWSAASYSPPSEDRASPASTCILCSLPWSARLSYLSCTTPSLAVAAAKLVAAFVHPPVPFYQCDDAPHCFEHAKGPSPREKTIDRSCRAARGHTNGVPVASVFE